jgi:hypothetical protein
MTRAEDPRGSADAEQRLRWAEDDFWADRAAPEPGAFVAETSRGRERFWFRPSCPVSASRPGLRGSRGARWAIRFRDGRPAVETNDLSGNGVIPGRFWDQFPVTADLELLEARPKS